MTSGLPDGYVIPKPQISKTAGTLNIVFACLLVAYGLFEGASMLLAPILFKFAEEQVTRTRDLQKQQREDRIKDLKAREEAATDPTEKEALTRQRAQVESRPVVEPPNLKELMGVVNDPRIAAFNWGAIGTGLVLNVAMFVAGIGLVRLKEWGRRLGLGVAGLKIARLIAYGIFGVFLLVPAQVEASRKVMEKMERATAQANPAAMGTARQMAGFTAISATVQVIFYVVLGAVWPAIALYLLSRPGAKAACASPWAKPPENTTEPDLP